MKACLFVILYSFTTILSAQNCVIPGPKGPAHFVCYDGRALHCESTGYVWYAKRGCFISSVPCCKFDASHYGYYSSAYAVHQALIRCKEGWPYHLGEMQTH